MLKPCPFCGGKDLETQTQTMDREGVPTCIICQSCGAIGPWCYEKPGECANAEKLWDKRKLP